MGVYLSSPAVVLATIAEHGPGFIAETKGRDDCQLFKLTRKNTDYIQKTIAEEITWSLEE